jgi:hypothetical protein
MKVMGTDSMPTTAHPRYGRPKGSGLDDTMQLESIAALLAANPGLKTTTAIRSLGIEDPSAIRRLRDKFHVDQARLMANARRGFHTSNVRTYARPGLLRTGQARPLTSVRNPIPATQNAAPDNDIAAEITPVLPQQPLPADLFDLGLRVLTTAIEQQAVLAQHWLRLPAVEIAMRGQLAFGAFLVAAATPRKPLKPRIH